MRTGHLYALLGLLTLGSTALAAPRPPPQGVVNLNEATEAQLDLLPGIGPAAARRIVEHRAKRRFARVEELVRVKGFGRKKFLKLKPFLAVTGPTTLH